MNVFQTYKFNVTSNGFLGCKYETIEMRVVGTTTVYTTEEEVFAGTGDIVEIRDNGMVCRFRNGGHQPDGRCQDYEIRFCCHSH